MSSTEIFYHGTCYLFDRFSLSCSGSGEGKSKFGHGIYITSSYKTAECTSFNVINIQYSPTIVAVSERLQRWYPSAMIVYDEA